MKPDPKPRLKTDYVRSKALMEAYRRVPCMVCGIEDGTVVGAHSNYAEHGKGRGIKASDDKCASMCFTCHQALDQGHASRELKRDMWERAHEKTIAALIALSWDDWKLRDLLKRIGWVAA